jgi:hypothetical protein
MRVFEPPAASRNYPRADTAVPRRTSVHLQIVKDQPQYAMKLELLCHSSRILADTGGHRGKLIELARTLLIPVGLVTSRPGGPAWLVKRRRVRCTAYRGMRGQANRAANARRRPTGGSLPPITSRQARARTDRGPGAQRISNFPTPSSVRSPAPWPLLALSRSSDGILTACHA